MSHTLTSEKRDYAFTREGKIRLGDDNWIGCPALSAPYEGATNCIFLDCSTDRPGRRAQAGIRNVIEIGNINHDHVLIGAYDLEWMFNEICTLRRQVADLRGGNSSDEFRSLRQCVEELRREVFEGKQLCNALLEIDKVKSKEIDPVPPKAGEP